LRVFCGISGHSFPGFLSLRAFTRLNDDFSRFVSASKNSVPGDQPYTAQEVEGLCGLSGKSSGRAGLPESGA
jgi:hypothetical protein